VLSSKTDLYVCPFRSATCITTLTPPRGSESIGNGYGFPSSHSQYMAYFSSFLICHLYFRHRFSSTGSSTLDRMWRISLYISLLAWTGLVAFSRSEHSPRYSRTIGQVDGFVGTISDTIMLTRCCGDSALAHRSESPYTSVPSSFQGVDQRPILER
jgi:hypothetical protein